jgi:hypothetical protein
LRYTLEFIVVEMLVAFGDFLGALMSFSNTLGRRLKPKHLETVGGSLVLIFLPFWAKPAPKRFPK